jgi:hypothetical protein
LEIGVKLQNLWVQIKVENKLKIIIQILTYNVLILFQYKCDYLVKS